MTLSKRPTIAITILLIVGLFSCQNPRQSYIRGILSSGCFWDVMDKDFSPKNVKYTYRLLPSGACYLYRYNYINNEKQNSVSHLDQEKGEVDIKWHLKSDSELIIDQMDYKVLKVDKSTIWLEDSPSHSLLLQKNCSTFIID